MTGPLPEHVRVAVIGAGVSGLGAGIRLRLFPPLFSPLDLLTAAQRMPAGHGAMFRWTRPVSALPPPWLGDLRLAGRERRRRGTQRGFQGGRAAG